MRILDRLFSGSPETYVDEGIRLTEEIVQTLGLEGPKGGLVAYTPEEAEAISQELSSFQAIADGAAEDERGPGSRMLFHPEALPEIQRGLIARALKDLAGQDWIFGGKDEIPQDWRQRVATYLKAWAANQDPYALLEMGELLSRGGRDDEAKKAMRVVLLFPRYADAEQYYGKPGKETDELVRSIASRAHEFLKEHGG